MKKIMLSMLLAATALCVFAAPATQARIDVYARGEGAKGFTVADKGTTLSIIHPKWMNKEKLGGASVRFKMKGADWQTGTFTLIAGGTGRLYINAMGPDVYIPNSKKRIKVLVDYQKIVVNGETIFEAKDGKPLTVWHDEGCTFPLAPLKAGDTVKVEATFRPAAEE